MKKKSLIIALSLTGVLALSGTALAYASGTSFNSSQTIGSQIAKPVTAQLVSNQPITPPAASKNTVNDSTSLKPNNSTDNVSNSGYSMGSYANGNGGYGMMGDYGNGNGTGYGMMGGYGNGNGNGTGYGMMGTYGNGNGTGYGMMGGAFNGQNYSSTVKDQSSAASDMKASLVNATVDKSTNTITYTGKNVKIVMLGGPANADQKFVIADLINPTIRIPQGAKVTMEIINEDEGMPHGFEITNATPPYAYMSMMQGAIYPGSFIPPIPEAASNQYPSAQVSFTASQSGRFYYICQYPGHAEKGMYGKIIIG